MGIVAVEGPLFLPAVAACAIGASRCILAMMRIFFEAG